MLKGFFNIRNLFFYGVPKNIYDGLISTSSLGKYHDRFIKN
ncbi:KTSC domain-containing protein [Bacillus paralicheniformis]|nr:KTSC domain-containing protein [Bacillus paralicheniformis]